MRHDSIVLSIVLLSACSGPEQAPENVTREEIDEIQIRQSGWSARNIYVHYPGVGHFDGSLSDEIETFRLTEEEYDALVSRLETFRARSVPLTHDTAADMIHGTCPEDASYVTDAGGIWIRWIGLEYDNHYVAELGCDRERHAERNAELRAIIASLPVPEDY